MNKIAKLYNQIDFDKFILKDGKNSCYGTKALLWLDLILSMGGKPSMRDKANYLMSFKDINAVNKFLKSIGINKKFKKTPKKTTFYDYKKRVDLDKLQKFLEHDFVNLINKAEITDFIEKKTFLD